MSDEEITELLAGWRAPAPAPADTTRLLRSLAPLLPTPSPVRAALRGVPNTFGGQLLDALRAVRSQAGVLTPAFWGGSAAVMALGVALLMLGFDPGGGLVFYLLGPLLSYLGCTLGFRAARVGMLEFELACPISPRQLALARLTVVLGYDLVLVLAGGLPLSIWGAGALLELAVRWVGPLLLGAGLTLALSLRMPAGRAAALVYGGWVSAAVVLAVSRADVGIGIGPVAQLAMIPVGLGLLGVALAGVPRSLIRQLSPVSRTFEEWGIVVGRMRDDDIAVRQTRAATPLTVAGWELRRILATRRSLPLLAAALAVFIGLVWLKSTWQIPVSDARHITITVFASTAYGQIQQVVGVLLLFFGVILPFVATDAVAGDRRARVHELLMTTRLASWSYVVGRYAAALVVGLVLALCVLVAQVAGNALVERTSRGAPAVDVLAAVQIWALFVLPAVLVVTGVCFLLGTVVPQLSTPVKVAALVAWVALGVITDIGHGLSWFGAWVPTGTGVLKEAPVSLISAYRSAIAGGTSATGAARAAQERLPDLRQYLGPHLGLVAIGLAAVLLAVLGFDRFRRTLG